MAGKDGKGPAAVLFDVDGTLVDTNYLNAVTWWEAFRQAGHDVPMAVVHRAIGMGSDLMLDKLLPGDRDRSADADIRTSHTALYAVYWSRLRPLPGAADLLRACKKRGLAVVLASSADEREFSMLRSVLDAEDAIDEATFSGEVDASKPAPDLVEVALDKAGVPAEDAVFVGDTVWDAQACRKASVPCIGVLSGGSSRDELTGAGAAEVYPGPAELLAALPQSLLGRLRLVGGSSFFFIRVAGELMLRGWARGRRVAGRAWLIFPVPVSYAPATAQGHWTTPRSPNDTARLRGIGTESGRGT